MRTDQAELSASSIDLAPCGTPWIVSEFSSVDLTVFLSFRKMPPTLHLKDQHLRFAFSFRRSVFDLFCVYLYVFG